MRKGALEHVNPVLPANAGSWSDPSKPGDSNWLFDLDDLKPDIYVGGNNPPQVPWRDVIRQCDYPNADHTWFHGSFPAFDEYLITVTRDDQELEARFVYPPGESLSGDRDTNFRTADNWVAARLGGYAVDVKRLRSDLCLTWHEKEDTRTIILVPRAIHGFVHHSGGIDVVNKGGIGSKKEDISRMEHRVMNGEELYRVEDLDLWRRAQNYQGYGAAPSLTVSYVCRDAEAGPTPAQQAKAAELLAGWAGILEQTRPLVVGYVQAEWPDQAGSSWQSWETELIIYPQELWDRIAAGIFCGFTLDPEHGLGLTIRGDGAMAAGPGDIAL